MIIYISIIFIFICILLFIKYLYRYYKTKMLYKSFYLDKRDTEEEITKEVVRYMIMSVIMACRLDSEKKLKTYIGDE